MKNILPNITTTQLSSIIVGFMIFITMIIATPQVQAQLAIPGSTIGCADYPDTYSSQPATNASNGCDNPPFWYGTYNIEVVFQDISDTSDQWQWQCSTNSPWAQAPTTCSADMEVNAVGPQSGNFLRTTGGQSSLFQLVPKSLEQSFLTTLGTAYPMFRPIEQLIFRASGTNIFDFIIVNSDAYFDSLFVNFTNPISNPAVDVELNVDGKIRIAALADPAAPPLEPVCTNDFGVITRCTGPSEMIKINWNGALFEWEPNRIYFDTSYQNILCDTDNPDNFTANSCTGEYSLPSSTGSLTNIDMGYTIILEDVPRWYRVQYNYDNNCEGNPECGTMPLEGNSALTEITIPWDDYTPTGSQIPPLGIIQN